MWQKMHFVYICFKTVLLSWDLKGTTRQKQVVQPTSWYNEKQSCFYTLPFKSKTWTIWVLLNLSLHVKGIFVLYCQKSSSFILIIYLMQLLTPTEKRALLFCSTDAKSRCCSKKTLKICAVKKPHESLISYFQSLSA